MAAPEAKRNTKIDEHSSQPLNTSTAQLPLITFIKTADILDALKTKLAALQLPPAYSSVPDYPALFQDVVVWADENLLAALEAMFVYSSRVCIIVPGGDDHKSERRGDVLHVTRTSDVHLLIADRNFGQKNLGLIGQAGKNPGIIAMKDLVVEQITGPSINLSNVVFAPASGEQLHITSKERENESRDCWAQTFTTYAGAAKVAVR
jgi:hypothetical protein